MHFLFSTHGWFHNLFEIALLGMMNSCFDCKYSGQRKEAPCFQAEPVLHARLLVFTTAYTCEVNLQCLWPAVLSGILAVRTALQAESASNAWALGLHLWLTRPLYKLHTHRILYWARDHHAHAWWKDRLILGSQVDLKVTSGLTINIQA